MYIKLWLLTAKEVLGKIFERTFFCEQCSSGEMYALLAAAVFCISIMKYVSENIDH